MDTIYIYGLFDPRDLARIRYVGQTSDLAARARRHGCKDKRNHPVAQWIRELRAIRLVPSLQVLETTTKELAAERESHWIEQTLSDLNVTPPVPTAPKIQASCPKQKVANDKTLVAVEREHILNVLAHSNGNKLLAAKTLGIGRQTLYNKLAAFDPEDDDAKLRRILDI